MKTKSPPFSQARFNSFAVVISGPIENDSLVIPGLS